MIDNDNVMEWLVFSLVYALFATALVFSVWHVSRAIIMRYYFRRRKLSIMKKFERAGRDFEVSMEIVGGTMAEMEKAVNAFNQIVKDLESPPQENENG